MSAQFIVIKKIIGNKKRNNDGSTVKDPIHDKVLMEGAKTVLETIRVDEIRAIRSWKKSKRDIEEGSIEGDISVIYMKSNDTERKKPEIHIEENYLKFSERLGAILLPDNG